MAPASSIVTLEAVYIMDARHRLDAVSNRAFGHNPMMLQSLPGILALAVATFAAAGEPAWVTYRSPSGFYSVDHPSDWRVEREENIVNIIPADEAAP